MPIQELHGVIVEAKALLHCSSIICHRIVRIEMAQIHLAGDPGDSCSICVLPAVIPADVSLELYRNNYIISLGGLTNIKND